MQEALQALRRKIVTFAVALLLLISCFKIMDMSSVKHKNHAIFDKKTNEMYMTDRKTYQEWSQYKDKDAYPFHLDSRFMKTSKSRTYVANPGQSYYLNRPGQS